MNGEKMANLSNISVKAVFILVFLIHLNGILLEKRYYDTFSGKEITLERVMETTLLNNTFWCVIEVEDCDPDEGRRLDGTCNNVRHPTRGGSKTPFKRILPAVYSKGFEPRKSKCGEDLPLARTLATSLLGSGQVPDTVFTQLMTHFWAFTSSDAAAPHDTFNYILWTPYCCLPKGKTDYMCTPNKIPDDDRVFRFSDIRCLNMTRPVSFQISKCLKNDTVPERINTATPLHDLSNVYGSVLNASLGARLYERGMLKFEVEEGRIWPPSYPEGSDNGVCRSNQANEHRCHRTPDNGDGTNTLVGVSLVAVWFWRLHNRIAENLAARNPCWDDDRLFYTARDINIALANQIYFYGLLPLVFGKNNMMLDGVITDSLFRDVYDANSYPQAALEYSYVLRWIHTVQDGRLKMYDENGYYLKQFPYVNLTLRTGWFAKDNNIDFVTQGSFRQPCAKFDNLVDPDLTGIALGPHQRAADLTTNDLAKGRYFGFQPYIKYREYCVGQKITRFDDLLDVIDREKIDQLKDAYKDVTDIDLLAGIWLENYVDGGYAPPTFYCIVVNQLMRNIITDRHWYERPGRPNAFTFGQMQEIKKYTIARLLCDVGDTVTSVTLNPFLRKSPENPLYSCKLIPELNIDAWIDPTCTTPEGYQKI